MYIKVKKKTGNPFKKRMSISILVTVKGIECKVLCAYFAC